MSSCESGGRGGWLIRGCKDGGRIVAGNRAAKGHLLDIEGLRRIGGGECERGDGGGRDDVQQHALEAGEREETGDSEAAALQEDRRTNRREP